VQECLRTMFGEGLGVPCEQLRDAGAVGLGFLVSAVSEGGVCGALSAAVGRGFDLSREPPVRGHLFALSAHEHVLLVVLHHIAGDGWSLAPLLRDLGRCYEARVRGGAAPLAALPVQYADYTLWQRGVFGGGGEQGRALARP